ncbi:MAG: hypothetical protein GY703_20920 [Gammaproteobacteria bacterium]|nr:hypothetical protein [Gammaproteobacteria bacterium]
MATHEVVMARINLFGVLRSIQELVVLDASSHDLVKDTKLTVEFVVRGGFRGALKFCEGSCEFIEGRDSKVDIRLFFTSPAHFNRMIDGKANPIPLKGLFKIGFLTGPFTKLTDRLTYFLRPEEGLLEDPEFFTINTKLTAFVAFHSLSEVGNWDDLGRMSASGTPDGVLQMQVQEEDGPALAITATGGRLSTSVGVHPDYRCLMWFKDLKSLSQILNGEMDAYTVFAQNRAGIRGYIPMADKLNPILQLLPGYLS